MLRFGAGLRQATHRLGIGSALGVADELGAPCAELGNELACTGRLRAELELGSEVVERWLIMTARAAIAMPPHPIRSRSVCGVELQLMSGRPSDQPVELELATA